MAQSELNEGDTSDLRFEIVHGIGIVPFKLPNFQIFKLSHYQNALSRLALPVSSEMGHSLLRAVDRGRFVL